MKKRTVEDFRKLVKESSETILTAIAQGASKKDPMLKEQIDQFMRLTRSFKRAYPDDRDHYLARAHVYFALGWYYRAYQVIDSGLNEYESDAELRTLYQKIEAVRGKQKKRVVPETPGERSFRERVESGVIDPHLEITVDGVKVEGRIIYLSGTDISVEITQPFSGISSGWHIPWFQAGYPQHLFCLKTITEKGKERARSTLSDIYRACRIFSLHADEIKVKYDEIKLLDPRRRKRRDLLLRHLSERYGESRIGYNDLEQLMDKYLQDDQN